MHKYLFCFFGAWWIATVVFYQKATRWEDFICIGVLIAASVGVDLYIDQRLKYLRNLNWLLDNDTHNYTLRGL